MADDTLTQMVNHLEFLGYTAETQDDGWTFLSHPTRADFYVKAFPFGVRGVAIFPIPDLVGDAEWLAFVNRCNDASIVASFAITSKPGRPDALRTVVLFPLAYDKVSFGALVEAWQQDLELLRDAPEREERAPVVMH